MISKKSKVLFVGSFKEFSKDGSVGGQMFACKSIINSYLNNQIEFTLIDSTADSVLRNSIINRIGKAFLRLLMFIYYSVFHRFDSILIFTADGLSFVEKGTMVLIAARLTRSKVILAPRSGLIVNDVNKRGFIYRYLKFVINNCHVIVCQSEIWKKYFLEHTNVKDDKKFIVIHNWIDMAPYFKLSTSYKKVKVKVLFLAWVDKNKGIYELLGVIQKLKNDSFDFQLIIAGGGVDLENAKRIVKENNLTEFVHFAGWVHKSEKLRLLEESEIFVLRSYFEGFPNSLLEAMASGKACIASNVGSIPDIIEDGETGFIINPRDEESLYHNLKKLLLFPDLRKTFEINSRKRVETFFTIDIAVAKFAKIL